MGEKAHPLSVRIKIKNRQRIESCWSVLRVFLISAYLTRRRYLVIDILYDDIDEIDEDGLIRRDWR